MVLGRPDVIAVAVIFLLLSTYLGPKHMALLQYGPIRGERSQAAQLSEI